MIGEHVAERARPLSTDGVEASLGKLKCVVGAVAPTMPRLRLQP
jgi:hypothetical protein